jgi:hypothetical protein
MTNPFLDVAELQVSAPRKARARAAEKRAAAKLDERDKLAEKRHAAQRKRLDALLAGPHGSAAQALIAFLQGMTLASAGELVEVVRAGPWLTADADTRFEVLALVDTEIVALRERHELVPFDDALPFSDEPPGAFLQLREWLK